MDTLLLYFPQWQGSGKTNEIYNGASLIKQNLDNTAKFTDIDQPEHEELCVDNQILGYSRIINNLEIARKTIEKSKPKKIFTLGGDCGVEVEPVSYLNSIYDSDLCVLWFDAHGDLNTPESSPSKTFHGMPLRVILGEGDKQVLQAGFSSLLSNQIILIGARDLDQPEQEYVKNHTISVISPDAASPEVLEKLIGKSGKTHLYIHLDLDATDPQEIPHVKCPTINGIPTKKLHAIITYLKENYSIVGGSIVEYAPKTGGIDTKVLELAKTIFSMSYS